MKNKIICFFAFLLLLSCSNKKTYNQPGTLEFALQLSGNNRGELEKVLSHYSKAPQDSLKLEAVKFLIKNMIFHYAVSGDLIDAMIEDIDSSLSKMPASEKIAYYQVAARVAVDHYDYHIEYDIDQITSEFLINNIEKSFKIWENNIFKISFEEFCEDILPYRVSYEALVDWKDFSMCFFDLKGFSQSYPETPNRYSIKSISTHNPLNLGQLHNSDLKNHKADCIDISHSDVYSARNTGYASSIDYVPHYADRNGRHFWARSMGETTRRGINSKFPKVYRKSFSLCAFPKDDVNHVPFYLRDFNNKDVTDLYTDVARVNYQFKNLPKGHKYAYLAVFNNQTWQEVAWTKANKKTVSFDKMGKEIVYMPSFYKGQKQVLGHYPIYLNSSGEIKELIPNKNITHNLRLTRKYKYNVAGDISGIKLIGSKFLATNNLNNRNFDTLGIVSDYEYMNYDSIAVKHKKKYKYLIYAINKKPVRLSSVLFYDENSKVVTGKSFRLDPDTGKLMYIKNRAFDQDPLTGETMYKLSGIELDHATRISKIKYMSSNDDNSIVPGELYELFYFEKGKWISLGKKLARKQELHYKNVPSGALYWLRNLTKGVEERPFTVEDGKIRFF